MTEVQFGHRVARTGIAEQQCWHSFVGTDFMPKLDKGAFLIQTVLPPQASLAEVDRINHKVEDVLREFPV